MHERDVTILSVLFDVTIIQPQFSSSEVNPFIGYADGENFHCGIVSYVVPFLDLCIVKDVFQSIFIEVHISDILEGSGGVAMGCSFSLVDVTGLVYGLDI